jgi:uncharacterized integral membrane protein
MNDLKRYRAVARVNFRSTTWKAYLAGGIPAAVMVVDYILDATVNLPGDSTVSAYSMLYAVCLLAPILIVGYNYPRLMNIGVKNKTFFFGCIINYVVLAAAVSLIGVLEYYLLDLPLIGRYETIYGLIPAFGWNHSPAGAFFSQFAFLLMVEAMIHTLTFMQTRWYGWAADALILVILCVFTPIPVLRQVEEFFFRMTIFQRPAILQIAVCLALAVGVYATNLFYMKRRNGDESCRKKAPTASERAA